MAPKTPKKILIVEDDTFLSSIYSKKFTSEGYEVIQALDGKKGMILLREKQPDIVLLDIMLPEMDGLEVLEKISQDNKLKKIPVIMLTNVSEKDKIDRAFSLGAKDYIIKTFFTPKEVLEKIQKFI